MDRLLESALFLVGLIFGSFLNVCISRIPRDESIISPPSYCPRCGAAIRWFDNFPLLSWILLRRRCRDCGQRIFWRYPVVELLTGLVFLGCGAAFGVTWFTLKFCVFSFLLIGLIFMDAETGLLPREFTYTGLGLGFIFASFAPTDFAGTSFLLRIFGMDLADPRGLSLLDALAGAAVGAGFFYFAWAVYYLVRKQHGLGFGDVALMGMSGAFLGLKLVVLVIALAPNPAVVYVAILLARESFRPRELIKKEQTDDPFLTREIPFGVFLGACSLLAIFAGRADLDVVSAAVLGRNWPLRHDDGVACACGDLFQMVTRMGAVKLPPFLCIQRTEERVVKEQSSFPEAPFSVVQGGIHCDQCIVEMPHGFSIDPVVGQDLPEGGSSARHVSELRHDEFSYAVWQRRL